MRRFAALIIFALLAWSYADAKASLDYSGSGSSGNNFNNLNLGYSLDTFVDPADDSVGWSHDFDYAYGDSVGKVTLNSTHPEFQILTKSHDFNYKMTVLERLVFKIGAGVSDFNSSEASAHSYSYGAGLKFGDLKVSMSFSQTQTKQNQEVIILGKNVTSDMKFNRKGISADIDYQWNESIFTRLSATTYQYDQNLNNFSVLLSTTPFLNRSGPGFVNEVQAQLKSSVDLSLTYNLNDNWMFQVGLGQTQDQLAPQDKSENYTLGAEYENDLSKSFHYHVNAGYTGGQTAATGDKSASGNVGFGFDF